MTKYGWIAVSTLLTIVITLIAQELETIATLNTLEGAMVGEVEFSSSGLLGFFNTYWNLLTFNLTGIPAIFTLFFMIVQLPVGIIIGELVIKAFDAIWIG